MILKTSWSISISSFFILFSFGESLIPATIHRFVCCAGACPLKINSGGFVWFAIGISTQHQGWVITFNVNFIKLRNISQSQIWDPGISNFEFEVKETKFRSDLIAKTCLLYISMVTNISPLFLKAWTRSDEDEIISFPWLEDFTLPDISLQIGVLGLNFIMYFFDDIGWKLYLWLDTFASRDQRFIHPLYHYHNETYEVPMIFYQSLICLKSLPKLIWWHQRHTGSLPQLQVRSLCFISSILWYLWNFCLWQDQRMKRQRRFTKEDINYWSELSSISTSRRCHGDREGERGLGHIVLSFIIYGFDFVSTTFTFFLLVKVMQGACWSFIYKMIANYKCMKGGSNRFSLLAYKPFLVKAWSFLLFHRNCFQFPLFALMVVLKLILYFVKLFHPRSKSTSSSLTFESLSWKEAFNKCKDVRSQWSINMKSTLFLRTRLRTNWYRVNFSKHVTDAMDFSCTIWKAKKAMPIGHTHRIKGRRIEKKKTNSIQCCWRIRLTLKGSSVLFSFFLISRLQCMAHISAYVIICNSMFCIRLCNTLCTSIF